MLNSQHAFELLVLFFFPPSLGQFELGICHFPLNVLWQRLLLHIFHEYMFCNKGMVKRCFTSDFLFFDLCWLFLTPYHGSFFQNCPSSPSTLDWGISPTYHPADPNSSSSILSYLFPKVPQNIPGNIITKHSLCMTCSFIATYHIWVHVFLKSSASLRYSWPYNWTTGHELTSSCQSLIYSLTIQAIFKINSHLSIMTGIHSSILIYIIY